MKRYTATGLEDRGSVFERRHQNDLKEVIAGPDPGVLNRN
jgi:hypothetical protein